MALKLKLKVSSSGNTTPTTPKVEPPLPKLKLTTSKVAKDQKKLKINLTSKRPRNAGDFANAPKMPKIRIKPTRVPGDGYDSEAPDLEDDPLLESGIVVRFLNDLNLDQVHHAAETGNFNGISVKWISKLKALISINKSYYSARLIDLPTITEIHKTIDKKNIFKTFDISQMLLVLHPADPHTYQLDKDFEVPPEYLYKHPLYGLSPNGELRAMKQVLKDGLTSPFEGVHRRLRARKVDHRIMEDVDARVNEMIKLDDAAEESHFELVDIKKSQRYTSDHMQTVHTPTVATPSLTTPAPVEEYEEDIGTHLEEELNKMLGSDDDESDEEAVVAAIGHSEDEEDEEDDDEDEGSDDDASDDGSDDDSKEGKQHIKLLEEEIADLENVVEHNRNNLATATSKMMRMKFQNTYASLKSSLDLKKRDLAKYYEEQDKLQKKADPNKIPDMPIDEEDEDEDDGEGEVEGEGEGDDIDDLF